MGRLYVNDNKALAENTLIRPFVHNLTKFRLACGKLVDIFGKNGDVLCKAHSSFKRRRPKRLLIDPWILRKPIKTWQVAI